ncbi:MAG: hypothetical protein WA876_02085 [Candidatus Acidiferrales bacterium]
METKALKELIAQFSTDVESPKMSSSQKLHVNSASVAVVASVHEKSVSIAEPETLDAVPVQPIVSSLPGGIKAEEITRIAHDFNNLLTLVLGYGETILISLPDNRRVCQYATHICNAAREGARLSASLSALVQRKSPQP